MKILNPGLAKEKFIICQLHNFQGRFTSIEYIQSVLSSEFAEHVSCEKKFVCGYFNGRTKCWLISVKDVEMMYKSIQSHEEIFLWCEGKGSDNAQSEATPSKKDKVSTNRRREREEAIDDIFDELRSKHAQAYSPVQLRLWARMISSGIHVSTDDPPNVPMISGNLPKRSKQDTSTGNVATDVIVEAVAKALVPKIPSSSSPPAVCTSTSASSPVTLAEVRMKNLEQLKFLQGLYDSGTLTATEFDEQKDIILTCLRNLV